MAQETITRIKPLEELVDPEWAQALQPVASNIHDMGNLLRTRMHEGHPFLPHGSQILRAFTIPFRSIHVLIVGQDPYPTPGHPVGLSFSVNPQVQPLPASLRNIYTELHDDLGITPPEHGDLTPWTTRGVMLLNRCLTVDPGKPGSHHGFGWEIITDQAIRALNNRTEADGTPTPLVAILWGKQAQSLAPLLTNATLITSPHPSPLSAYRGFFGSKPFSRTNQALIQLGAEPIDWSL